MSYRFGTSSYVDFFKQGGDPATRTIIALNVVTFVLRFVVAFFGAGLLGQLLAFSPDGWMARPWTLLTYPVLAQGGDPILLLFSCYWLWVVGGSLERSWSTRTFVGFFTAITTVSALGIWVGYLITGVPNPVAGLFLPLSALTVAWCYLNPHIEIRFFFVLPMRARHLAWLDMALTVFYFGQSHPLNGFLALSGVGIALLWLRGVPWADAMSPRILSAKSPRSQASRPSGSPNPFEAIARWRRKQQFKRLWRDSGLPDTEDDLEIPPR